MLCDDSEILEEADWMDDETKLVAKEKAEVINERIGFPDFLLNDTQLCARYDDVSCQLCSHVLLQ